MMIGNLSVPADRSVKLRSHAKLNLSLYVTGRREDGYHDIVSVMQDLSLHDDVKVSIRRRAERDAVSGGYAINLRMIDSDVPSDENNLAYRGAKALLYDLSERGAGEPAELRDLAVDIEIVKKLPVAAGIAGGSGNAAVTMLALNLLLGSPYELRELMDMGAGIGADVPFSIMMNAYRNREVLSGVYAGAGCVDVNGIHGLRGIEEASPAALMRGIGDIVAPVEPIEAHVILMNPGTGVSTAAAYAAVDAAPYAAGPYDLFYNIFEEFIYSEDAAAGRLKAAMDEHLHADHILLSGSGPTIAAYYSDEEIARNDFKDALGAGWTENDWKIWYAMSGGESYEF